MAAGLLAVLSLAFGIAAAATSLDTGPVASTAASQDAGEPSTVTRSSPDAPAPTDALVPETPPGGEPGADEQPTPGPPEPATVTVPSVGIDASLESVGVDEDQRLVVPPPERAGWFDGRAAPGEVGPAVLVGHVDSRDGPAVFHGLDRVRQGDRVEVTDEHGERVTFEVERVEVVAKTAFPTSEVYDPVDRAELRLITCGGPFDQQAGSYRDNVIVYAVAVDDDGAADG